MTTDLATAPSDVSNTVTLNSAGDVIELQSLLRDPEAFETFFKKKAVAESFGKGNWRPDGKKGFRLVFPDGSYVRIKFFNTVKKIFNIKTNIEEPGKESWLSYIDVAVMPAGVKGYMFITDKNQHVWKTLKSVADAKHVVSVQRLHEKAAAFGIDLTQPDAWETYFAGKL